MKPFNLTLLFLFLLIVSSCSVQKRVHNRGFHAGWRAGKSSGARLPSKQALNSVKPGDQDAVPVYASLTQPAFGPITEQVFVLNRQTPPAVRPAKDSCDKIMLKGGYVMRVDVVDVSNDQVKYRDCKDTSAAIKLLPAHRISAITYSGGLKVSFDDDVIKEAAAVDNKLRKVPDSVLMADAIGFMGLFIAGIPFGIAAIILGMIGITRIQKSPEKHKGRGWAVFAIAIGLIDITGALIVITNM